MLSVPWSLSFLASALVSRDGDSQIPGPDPTLRHGDRLTFVGRRDAAREAIEQCHPEP